MEIRPIAYMQTDFKEKFGIPRQSGRVPSLCGRIVMVPEFRNPEAFRGLEEFSHLWVLFDFSEAHRPDWSPTIRPPRLGGNKRVGVFASRSPFRPNPIGLSCVRLERLEQTDREGTVLVVSGIDLLDGTPILDIKPYIPYTDSRPDASGSYAETFRDHRLKVDFPEELLLILPEDKRNAAVACLADDPRPSYQNDPDRVYSMCFSDYDIHFKVQDGKVLVTGVDERM